MFNLDYIKIINETCSTIDLMLDQALCNNSFNDYLEAKEYILKENIININTLGSQALCVPAGQYMVYQTKSGMSMLVPVKDGVVKTGEVYEGRTDEFEIATDKLLNNWNKLSKPSFINEDEDKDKDDEDEDKEEFTSRVDSKSVDRTKILQAMEDRGYTVSELAAELNVDPPAISRILRIPSKNTLGDPGGRNPSIQLASELCAVLQIGIETAFPDIFKSKKKRKKRKGNRGSGETSVIKKRKRKAVSEDLEPNAKPYDTNNSTSEVNKKIRANAQMVNKQRQDQDRKKSQEMSKINDAISNMEASLEITKNNQQQDVDVSKNMESDIDQISKSLDNVKDL